MIHDQADELRHLVRHATVDSRSAWRRPRMVLAVGGRDGVGTTTVISGIGAMMASQGRRVVLIEGSPRRGGGKTPDSVSDRSTFADVIHGRAAIRRSIIPAASGLRLVPAPDAADMPKLVSPEQAARLLGQIHDLGFSVDTVLVDLGSGPTSLARALWGDADAILLVTTPDDAAVMDAYAVLKAMHGAGGRGVVHPLVTRTPSEDVVREVRTRLARVAHRFLALRIGEAFGLAKDDVTGSFMSTDPAVRAIQRVVDAVDCPAEVIVQTLDGLGA